VQRPGVLRPAFQKLVAEHPASFLWYHVQGAKFPAPYHYHPELELTYIAKSCGQRFVGDSIEHFETHDLLLLGPNLPHVWLNEVGCRKAEAFVIHFGAAFLGERFLCAPELTELRQMIHRSSRGIAFSPSIGRVIGPKMLEVSQRNGAARLLGLLEILVTLSGSRTSRLVCGSSYEKPLSREDEKRIDAMYRYLNAHFRETIVERNVAKLFGMSAGAFSRFFHAATGRTFTKAIGDLRISHACQRLRDTDKTVAEICFDCGFENLSNFNRQFKARKGMAPNEFRRCLLTNEEQLPSAMSPSSGFFDWSFSAKYRQVNSRPRPRLP
jgi:AraC-like DNA-binding protein